MTYVLDADAQIAAARANLWRYLRSRRAWIRMGIGLLVMLAIGAVLGVAIGEDPLWWMLVFAAEMAVLFPLIYGLLYLFLPRRIRRLVAQSAIWRRPVEVTWSTAGMSARSPHGETELAWTDYHGWYAARSGFCYHLYSLLQRPAISGRPGLGPRRWAGTGAARDPRSIGPAPALSRFARAGPAR